MKSEPYTSDLFRRPDTDPTYRTLFENVCLTAIDIQFLSSRSALAFNSLAAIIVSHHPLTDDQFANLKSIKFEHDMRKRSDGIAKGRLRGTIDAATDYRLNTALNPARPR